MLASGGAPLPAPEADAWRTTSQLKAPAFHTAHGSTTMVASTISAARINVLIAFSPLAAICVPTLASNHSASREGLD